MSVNISKFMRGDVYDWIFKNIDAEFLTSFPNKKDFWIIPVESDLPESKEIISDLLEVFGKTKIEKIRVVDGIGVAVLRQDERVVVCGGYLDGRRKISISNNLSESLKKTEISFLQKILVISKIGMTSSDVIKPSVWKNSPIFEDDIKYYFPSLISLELGEDSEKDSADSLILRFLMSVESGADNVKEFHQNLVEVMLSMPNEKHDWLVYQLLHSVLAGRNTGFYSELYRIVEFFFPLHKVEKLKGSIKYSGELLNLLDVCMNDLGWHVNHQMGSRMALNYANISFAEIMLDKSYDGSSEDEQKKFKEAAMEKITDIRHSLIHQSFKQVDQKEEDLKRATKSLLSFLASSFSKYNANSYVK